MPKPSQSGLASSARTRALCALPTKYRTSAKREVELRTSRSSTTTKTTTTHRRRRPPPGIPQSCNSRFPNLRHIKPTCRRLARRRSSERARGTSRPKRHRSGILLMTSLSQRKSVYQRRRPVAVVLQCSRSSREENLLFLAIISPNFQENCDIQLERQNINIYFDIYF